MPDLPSGTITFLFTDIEGSTRLWDEHPEAMREALLQHDTLLRACIETSGGHVFKTMGDAFCAAFPGPRRALEAVLAAQEWLPALSLATAGDTQSLKVRMALHAGLAEERDGDYFGPPLNRVARLLAIGHGGQVLLSGAARALLGDDLPAGASLQDRGSHRLRDLQEPEQVFQLLHPDLQAEFPSLRSLSTHPNNLPRQLTSFIGRERQIAVVKQLLGGAGSVGGMGSVGRESDQTPHPSHPSHTRLLTLTGSGGCGKTRLALQVSAEALEQFPDGAWLVELGPLTDPSLLPQTVANVLGLKEEPGRSLTQTLTDHLRSRHLLLVLDNCEHLLDACAQLAEVVLRSSPGVEILATSRQALGIAGETTYRVPSLSLPDPGTLPTPESLSRSEAARLFIERAVQAQTGFAVTNRNAPALASVCCRLDGIPLAIELAAVRVRSLTVEDINGRLDQRFRLLTGGSRTALPRQQTLRSLIDWSYDLLNEAEKALLCRLSVFAGGWTLEAAESVCGEGIGGAVERCKNKRSDQSAPPLDHSETQSLQSAEVLDLLTSLCDKSLVVAETAGWTVRYRLLETVRQYARERLLETGCGDVLRRRHCRYFVALAEHLEPRLTGTYQAAAFDQLQREHDNVRAALEWTMGAPADVESALRLCSAVDRYWEVRSHYAEGRAWCAAALGQAESVEHAALHGAVLNGAGNLAWRQSDYPAAQSLQQEALDVWRKLGDRGGIASSLNSLGNLAAGMGDTARARVLHEECLAIRRELGDQREIAVSLNNLANVASAEADHHAARALHEQSLAIHRELGNELGIAMSLDDLGGVLQDLGDFAGARALHSDSLAMQHRLGNRLRVAYSLDGLASLAEVEGASLSAARLWGAVERLREDLGAPRSPSDRTEHRAEVHKARSALADAALFDAAWEDGHAMTLDQAIAHALEQAHA